MKHGESPEPATRSYFYLGGDSLHTGIYVDLLRRLEDQGVRMGLVARVRVSPDPVATWKAWKDRDALGPNRIEDVRRKLPAGVHRIPMWNLFPGLSLPWLSRMLAREAPRGTIVIHTRQIVMGRLGLALRRLWPRVRMIAEFEGDDLAELDYKRMKAPPPSWLGRLRGAIERRYYRAQGRRILLGCDAALCVSNKLKEVLVTRYAVPAAKAAMMRVLPTFASRKEFAFDAAARERVRRENGWSDRYLVIYSGNLRGAWQVPDKLVEAFVMIRERRPDAFFLVLTPDSDRPHIETHLRRMGVPAEAWHIRSSPHGEMVKYLCAADVALLLRDRHPMNEAASPGKFGEYALTGLPIILTDGIGDFSVHVRECALACVLPDLSDPDTMRELMQRFCVRDFSSEERREFSLWAADRFAIESMVPRLADLYRSV